MLLNITYLGKKKIPLTRNSFEPALKEIKVPPLLIKRLHERSNLKNIYHSYGGLFVAPSDAVDVLEYDGMSVIFATSKPKNKAAKYKLSIENIMSKVSIYTDGACKGNPGIGGWGAVLMCGTHTKEIYGGEPNTTNNRMEVTAVIKALHALKKPCNVILHSDSKYVVDGASKWLSGWFENNWRTARGLPVKNLDLWKELFEVSNKHSIEWVWVKGHSGNAGNDLADQLANKGILSI